MRKKIKKKKHTSHIMPGFAKFATYNFKLKKRSSAIESKK